jgi:hypothetical protein
MNTMSTAVRVEPFMAMREGWGAVAPLFIFDWISRKFVNKTAIKVDLEPPRPRGPGFFWGPPLKFALRRGHVWVEQREVGCWGAQNWPHHTRPFFCNNSRGAAALIVYDLLHEA